MKRKRAKESAYMWAPKGRRETAPRDAAAQGRKKGRIKITRMEHT